MKTAKITIDLSNFESISEHTDGKLIGGFSASFSENPSSLDGEGSNNCQGGNCASGCGTSQNVGCNTTAGCGVK